MYTKRKSERERERKKKEPTCEKVKYIQKKNQRLDKTFFRLGEISKRCLIFLFVFIYLQEKKVIRTISTNILLFLVVLLVVEYELALGNQLVDQFLFHVLMHYVQQFQMLFQH